MRSLIALLLLGLLVAGCDKPSSPRQQAEPAAKPSDAPAAPRRAGSVDRSHAGTPALAIPFLSPDGETTSMADFRGKPVLLNLWATWCAPCVKEMPTLDTLAGELGDRVQVVALAQDDPEKVLAYFEQAEFKALAPFVEKRSEYVMALGANLPATILYDSEGREVWRVLGERDWTTAESKALVAEGR